MTQSLPRLKPSASYSVTIRTENPHTPGMVGRISSAIGDAGGLIGAIDVIDVNKDRTVRDFVVAAADAAQEESTLTTIMPSPNKSAPSYAKVAIRLLTA